MFERRDLGRIGEELATIHLQAKGYRIIERNLRSRYGEIDIIAMDRACLVFVEVRTVQSRVVTPEESVNQRKQRQIANLAMRYLQQHDRTESDWRADVVAIEIATDGKVKRIDHIQNAVEVS